MSLDVSPTGSAGSGVGAARRVSTPAAFSHAHGSSTWTGRTSNPFAALSPAQSPARTDLLSPTTASSSPAGALEGAESMQQQQQRGRPARLDADELAKRVSTASIVEEEGAGSLDVGAGESSSSEDEEDEDEMVEETVHERIERELNELEEVAGTGVRFLIARQGMRLGAFFFAPPSSCVPHELIMRLWANSLLSAGPGAHL